MVEMLIICNRMTKSKKYTILRIKYKKSKSYFTNHMGCNNNKIAMKVQKRVQNTFERLDPQITT